ncbi:MAG: cytochrome c biogenesis heme-transporting ATPase CcmA [Porticoccaceae bacterium]
MAAANILKIESLAFERNDVLLFEPVSFELNAGEALHIEGVNGAGKTTLFQLLIKILEPYAGSLYYCGQHLNHCQFEYLSDILFIGHQSAVKAVLTVEENLRWMSPNNTSSETISKALQSVGLEHYASIPCCRLSAGQNRRVALARLMTTSASLWYLDEPFAALDKQGVSFIEGCMQNHLDQGGSIVFSSHQDPVKIAARSYRLNSHKEEV